jgi:DNA/RNA endonuclease YhcR with UshA esterase domain
MFVINFNMKEQKLILICLFISILGLILIYTAAVNLKPTEIEISQINPSFLGKTVKTTGVIVHKRGSKGGHIFLTISDNKSEIQVPLFYNFAKSLSEKLDLSQLRSGIKISVVGIVDEYMGKLQIIPRKPEDIKLVK